MRVTQVTSVLGMDEDGKVPVCVQLIQRISDRQDDVANIRCDLFKVVNFIALPITGFRWKNETLIFRFSVYYLSRYY